MHDLMSESSMHVEVSINGDVSQDNGNKCGKPRDSSGWDGKQRVDRRAVVEYPEEASHGEDSDEDALPKQDIDADEGESRIPRTVPLEKNF